jgi:hypothetical protein
VNDLAFSHGFDVQKSRYFARKILTEPINDGPIGEVIRRTSRSVMPPPQTSD